MSRGTGRPTFWIDEDWDWEHASNGVSRYATYVRQAERRFGEALEFHGTPNRRAVTFAASILTPSERGTRGPGRVERGR